MGKSSTLTYDTGQSTGKWPDFLRNAGDLPEFLAKGEPMAGSHLDSYDRAILRVLSTEGRVSVIDLAARIGLSKSPTQARVKRLERGGVITGYRAMLDPIRIGQAHVAFVEVRLTDTREALETVG